MCPNQSWFVQCWRLRVSHPCLPLLISYVLFSHLNTLSAFGALCKSVVGVGPTGGSMHSLSEGHLWRKLPLPLSHHSSIASQMGTFVFYVYLLSMCMGRVCAHYAAVRGQLVGTDSLLPCGFWGIDSNVLTAQPSSKKYF